MLLDSDNALLLDGIIYTGAGHEHTAPERTMSQTTLQVSKRKKKTSRENEQEKGKHFIVLPKGLGHTLAE